MTKRELDEINYNLSQGIKAGKTSNRKVTSFSTAKNWKMAPLVQKRRKQTKVRGN